MVDTGAIKHSLPQKPSVATMSFAFFQLFHYSIKVVNQQFSFHVFSHLYNQSSTLTEMSNHIGNN